MAISDKVESPPMIVGGEELTLDAVRPVHEPATGEVPAHVPEPAAGLAASAWTRDVFRAYALEECTAIRHVVYELTGTPRKGWYDAVSKPRERE